MLQRPPSLLPQPPEPRPAARRCHPPIPDRVKGVRIFDITDITHPKQVADVQTCRGSHTHTLLVDPKDKDNVYIYVAGSGRSSVRQRLAGCSDKDP